MSTNSLLVKSAELLGIFIRDADDRKLGVIREIFLDPATGQAKFVVVELSSFFGSGGKFHPLPWRALTFDTKSGGYIANISKAALKGSPAYDRGQLAETNYRWDEQTERYFSDATVGASKSPADDEV